MENGQEYQEQDEDDYEHVDGSDEEDPQIDDDDDDDEDDDELDNANDGSDEEETNVVDDTDNNDESEFVPRNVNDMEYIKTYHPEAIPISFDVMYERSIINRNKDGIIVDPLHKTLPILSKYEKTKIIGLRVSQLNKGAQPFISGQQSVIDNHIIANKELIEKKIPFIIKRPLPNGNSEFWFLKDLELI
jgi:DNA-directed RNA polymerase I, II, and III subunit RPABC2